MNETTQSHPPIERGIAVIALLMNGLSLMWYLNQVVEFGFAFDMIDLIGAYFVLSGIAVVVALCSDSSRINESGFLFLACALGTATTPLFLGQFLRTFDPLYQEVGLGLYPYLLRGLFLGASLTTILALGPRRFFRIPTWLLILTCLAITGWLFVYACPSVVREWYGTRVGQSEFFPEGILMFSRKNPEREIQDLMLFASSIALLITIVVGRVRNRSAHGEVGNKLQSNYDLQNMEVMPKIELANSTIFICPYCNSKNYTDLQPEEYLGSKCNICGKKINKNKAIFK